jgi:hypothetical protein
MAKKAEINSRRKELCSYKFRGFPLDKIAETLSGKYGVTKSTIEQDWYNRESWLGEVFDINLDEEDLLILDIISEEKEIKRECWKTYHDTENDSVKLGSIKQLREINNDLIKMLQSIGAIKEEPRIVGVKIIDDVE